MKRVFILGSVNTDLVITATRFPEQGETVSGKDFFVARGGKGANQAVACARSGGKTLFCGCVGDDAFGKEALSSLQKEGIDVRNVKVVPNCPSGTALIVLIDGNNRIIVNSGANARIEQKDVDDFLSRAEDGDIFLTQAEIPTEIVLYALKKAKEKGLYTILNPAPAAEKLLPCLPYCDLITPNETEAKILGGKDVLSRVPVVLTTLGENGYEIATEKEIRNYPCKKITPVDTTGAGDTFCGALAARLSINVDLFDAARFGSAAATLACTKKGAQPSIPTLQETTNFMNK